MWKQLHIVEGPGVSTQAFFTVTEATDYWMRCGGRIASFMYCPYDQRLRHAAFPFRQVSQAEAVRLSLGERGTTPELGQVLPTLSVPNPGTLPAASGAS